MPAYDIAQHDPARPVHLEPTPKHRRRELSRSTQSPRPGDRDAASVLDDLLDRLVDRLANAVVARLAHPDHDDEWLDSRQAAQYLGLHRDTLRRLAAARAIPSEQDGQGCKLFFRRDALDEWRRCGGRRRHLSAVGNAA